MENVYKKKENPFSPHSPSSFRPGGPATLPRALSWAWPSRPSPFTSLSPPLTGRARLSAPSSPNRRPALSSLSRFGNRPAASPRPASPTFSPPRLGFSWRNPPHAPEPSFPPFHFLSPCLRSARPCAEKPSPEFFRRAKLPSRANLVVLAPNSRRCELRLLPCSLPVLLPSVWWPANPRPRSPK